MCIRDSVSAALAILRGLNPAQAAAFTSIVEGGSMTAAAEAAGVARGTLYRWRTEDPRFIAAVKEWRTQERDSAYDGLSGLAATCTAAIAQAVSSGDARLAMRVLERLRNARDVPSPVPSVPVIPVYDGFMVR